MGFGGFFAAGFGFGDLGLVGGAICLERHELLVELSCFCFEALEGVVAGFELGLGADGVNLGGGEFAVEEDGGGGGCEEENREDGDGGGCGEHDIISVPEHEPNRNGLLGARRVLLPIIAGVFPIREGMVESREEKGRGGRFWGVDL